MKWGDKYDQIYVEKLKEQCEQNCSVPFNFYCLTDKPTQPYDIQIPTTLDNYYHKKRGFFWAYRKIHMFNDLVEGNQFLFLDLDVIIHQDLKYFFDLDMEKPCGMIWPQLKITIQKINLRHLTHQLFVGIKVK